MSSGVVNVRQPFQYSTIPVQLFLHFSCIPRLARESDRPPTAHTAKPKTAGGRKRGHRLTGAAHGRGVRARVGLSIPSGAGRGRGRGPGSCLGSVSEPGGWLSALRSGRGRAGGTAQAIAKKSGRGDRNSTPPIRKKLTSRRGGNASDVIEPKAPMYLSLIFGLIVRQVDS